MTRAPACWNGRRLDQVVAGQQSGVEQQRGLSALADFRLDRRPSMPRELAQPTPVGARAPDTVGLEHDPPFDVQGFGGGPQLDSRRRRSAHQMAPSSFEVATAPVGWG